MSDNLPEETITNDWGLYSTKGIDRILFELTNLGLGRGKLKEFIANSYQAKKHHIPVDVIRYGLKWRLYPWDNNTDKKILCGSTQRDKTEIKFLINEVKKGGTFIDIGANIGYYSIMAAANGAKKVYAFEPHPVTFSRLKYNITINRLEDIILPFQFGIASQSGYDQLNTYDDLGASSMLKTQSNSNHITVPIKKLSEVIRENNLTKINSLKIDIEGMEYSVLLPFWRESPPMSRPDMIIIEHAHITDDDGEKLFYELRQANYQVVAKTRNNLVLRRE